MYRFTAQGQQSVEDIAQRYGVSTDVVRTLLDALITGHGTMAQFTHPELGGSGQWMHDGMIMVGDMFNHALQAKVDGVCTELARLLAQQPGVMQAVSRQAHSPSPGGRQPAGPEVSLAVPTASRTPSQWWPAELGRPSSTGVQNHIRYAYFPAPRRLALDINGHVTIYDTLDYQISGVAQQQSTGVSLTFTSQCGVVQLASLPVVSVDGVPQAETRAAHPPEPGLSAPAAQSQEEIMTTIERLAALHHKGLLSDEEFTAKKTELLQRL
jgi:hypothetical protein